MRALLGDVRYGIRALAKARQPWLYLPLSQSPTDNPTLSLAARTAGPPLQIGRAADPLSYATATQGLVLVAFLACFLPARRATRINPPEVLRDE